MAKVAWIFIFQSTPSENLNAAKFLHSKLAMLS